MNPQTNPSPNSGDLRRRAEDRLGCPSPPPQTQHTDADLQRTLHELRVHEIELEMQNEELRETRARLETLLGRYTELYDFAPTGYLTLLADGTIREANLAIAAILQVERTKLLGNRLAGFIATADQATFAATLASARQSGLPHSCELALFAPPPELRFAQLSVTRSNDGHEYLVSLEDITARRLAEETRRALELRMLQAQKLESLGALAGGIAHDFNNLLMAILGNANLATECLADFESARAHLRVIGQSSHRAAALCRQLLAYAGQGRFTVEPVNLSALVSEMAQILQSSISKRAELRCSLPEEIPSIVADPEQIRQVVMNLLINASEALGDRSGTLRVTTGTLQCDGEYLRSCCPQIEPPPPGPFAFVEVVDSGCGMDAATQARMFDPFFSTKFTGRGLGLAALLGIVRRHHGTLKVDSERDRGTTIRVLFPANGEDAAKPPPPTARANWRSTGTLLVVEDEQSVRDILAKALRKWGFEVITATDGVEALDRFRERAPEIRCVLLDLRMPRLDGEQVFHELRRIRPDAKVILTSGFGDEEITRRLQGCGLAGFLSKPYEIEELNSTLRQVLTGEKIAPG